MKLLTYYYFFIRKNVEANCPSENAYVSALKTISFPVSMVLTACVFQFIVSAGLLEVILDFWPYDYGRVHSKNFIAPTSILFLVIYMLTSKVLKNYFINDETQRKLEEFYQSEGLIQREHRMIPECLTFFLILFAIFITFGVWLGVSAFLALLVTLELWIQSRFKSNT
ncbi:hypothetical protein [Ferrimonas aestuarii]|uniref:Uncharacterized protein n=1 Tax=Ferrimonas aestuarii TaxID=2569539 RepID=A0A4U1BQE3_9GAMM|nr:hypothetical protein [Ferrimonas aestuarii]TKB53343.1 hypothetical protein FCL42_14860 [Ferrimonas aestuarii]